MIPSIGEIVSRLESVYGFCVPNDFARVMAAIYEESWHSDGHYYSENFEAVLRPFFLLEGAISNALLDDFVLTNEFYGQSLDRRFGFLNMPPEFFPFGEVDDDGSIFGFIVHDPDAHSNGIAIGETRAAVEFLEFNRFRPISPLKMDLFLDDPITIVGERTASSLVRIFERRIASFTNELSGPWEEAQARIAMSAAARLSAVMVDSDDFPDVQSDWRFEPTLDGIGVYAPSDKFWASSELWTPPQIDSVEGECVFIESFVKMGFPATALRLIRDLNWRLAGDLRCLEAIAPLWRDIYGELGRPKLAKAVTDALVIRSEIRVEP